MDSELREILKNVSTIGAGMDNFGALPESEQSEQIEAAIEQIKAAFSEASYITGDQAGMAMALGGYLQGQDWYDRFKKEFNFKFTGIETAATLLAKQIVDRATIAARRAAGLQDE